MWIDRLKVRGVRNLGDIDITPSKHLNLIIGKNGSGKTSLLESIYYASLARSFRGNANRGLIQDTQQALLIYLSLSSPCGTCHRIGLSLDRNKQSEIKVDGTHLKSRSALASYLPLQLITPESYRLLTDGPKLRRAFLDWSVFHVEHSFHPVWSRFRRALSQRNGALKQQLSDRLIGSWDDEVIATSGEIDRYRRKIVERLKPHLQRYCAILLPSKRIDLVYHQGWRHGDSLETLLREHLDRDRRMGFTGVGPHRSDLRFRTSGVDVAETFSRGQIKLLVSALLLAQLSLIVEETDKSAVVLIDDLPSELDRENRSQLLALLVDLGLQLFVTATELDALSMTKEWDLERQVFHVEHGLVKEVV